MSAFSHGVSYLRFLAGLRTHVRSRMTLDDARSILRRRMEARPESFLALARDAIYENPRSPYLPLLERAGCTLADLEGMVRSDGLETTLGVLRAEGVFVSFEEFKGYRPIVRGDLTLEPGPGDFVNPGARGYFRRTTGGSTGPSRDVVNDLEKLRAGVPMRLFADAALGYLDTPLALWTSGLPGYGVNAMLTRVPYDAVPDRWFTPTGDADTRPALRYRISQLGILGAARLWGARLPEPEVVPYTQPRTVLGWMAESLRESGRCLLQTSMSLALRVAVAAREDGVDLTGAIVQGGGEPPTPAKVGVIVATGARFSCSYHCGEIGAIGHACTRPAGVNDQHLLMDHLAMIQHPRRVPGFDVEVEPFLFTTLLRSAPLVLLNVEVDDCGVATERSCGCPFEEELGMTTHLGEIRSFRKLTGEGVTLIGSDVERILESVLPARFGGSPVDYQLSEEEDAEGFTRIAIVVSPRVDLPDEKRVVDTFLEELERSGPEAQLSRLNWLQTDTLRVRRAEPATTAGGKILPLQRHGGSGGQASS